MTADLPALSPEESARYEWQMWSPNVGLEGQRKLKGTSVLISRIGGVGGTVAYYLAAAGIGRLILAHAGNIRPDDLNRQLLMTTDGIGQPRIESAKRRLRELNPHVDLVGVGENISENNVGDLVAQADLIVDAAPLFAERFLMNRESVRQRRPLIEAAMYDFEGQVATFLPGKTACLACLYPEPPPYWKREFPVFGAVSGAVAAIAAVEVIKLVTGVGDTLAGSMLRIDLRSPEFRRLPILRDAECAVCGESGV